MKEFGPGCQRPKGQPKQAVEMAVVQEAPKGEERKMIQVGKPAPMFSAPAFYQGKFVEVDLAEFKGNWIMLCFYPGDFTFV
ncbi:MAG: redoxin domain-containing protein [Firmicutes bacterium]|nr:redoxin domain-containing protein [Bacillota bacterium]